MNSDHRYISYQQALNRLQQRLKATQEEFAMWAWLGRHAGGFDAYLSPELTDCIRADECASFDGSRCRSFAPPRLAPPIPDQFESSVNPWSWQVGAYFLSADIETFDAEAGLRWIAWPALVERWQQFGLNEDDTREKVCALVVTDQLFVAAPVFGDTTLISGVGAPDAWAMFPLADIEAIELQDFNAAGGGSLLQQRIAMIVQLASARNGGPMKLAWGEKANIERECLDNHSGSPLRFTKSTYKAAWQAARDQHLIDVEGVEQYRGG